MQVQNAGTVAGNLCNASPAADGIPPLLTLDASVEMTSPPGIRVLPLEDFLTGYRQTALGPDELVTAVLVPRECEGARAVFSKLGLRRYLVISVVMVAVAVAGRRRGRDGRAGRGRRLLARRRAAAEPRGGPRGPTARGDRRRGRPPRTSRASPRSTTSAPPPPTVSTPPSRSCAERSTGSAPSDEHRHLRRQRRAGRGRRRRPGGSATSCGASWRSPRRRWDAMRATAARAPCCWTANRSAPA